MKNTLITKAPAKINVFLTIGDKREDNFHPIASIFQIVSLYDEISISIENGSNISVECPFIKSLPRDNTAYKAAKMFLDTYYLLNSTLEYSVNIKIIKNIPSGAGLGGGSSDAASVLLSLNKMFGFPLSQEQLCKIALKIGSDVPFFIKCSCAKVTGRGEICVPIQNPPLFYTLLVDPGVFVSTIEAYNALDKARIENKTTLPLSIVDMETELDNIINDFSQKKFNTLFRNDFLYEGSPNFNQINNCISLIKSTNPLYTSMSGSGSVCYGLYNSLNDLSSAENTLQKLYKTWKCFPLACN